MTNLEDVSPLTSSPPTTKLEDTMGGSPDRSEKLKALKIWNPDTCRRHEPLEEDSFRTHTNSSLDPTLKVPTASECSPYLTSLDAYSSHFIRTSHRHLFRAIVSYLVYIRSTVRALFQRSTRQAVDNEKPSGVEKREWMGHPIGQI